MSPNRLSLLKSNAEIAIKGAYSIDKATLSTELQLTIDILLEELQTYHSELEMQNDELRISQLNIQQQQTHYQTLFNSFPLATILVNQQGLLIDINESALSLFGFKSLRQAKQHSFYRLMQPDQSDKIIHFFLNEDATKLSKTVQLRAKNHTFFPAKLNLTKIKHEGSLQGNTIINIEDLTIKQELKKERQLFDTMLNNGNAMVFALNRDFDLLLSNNYFQTFYQNKTFEGSSPHPLSFLSPELVNHIQLYYNDLFLNGIPQTFEWTLNLELGQPAKHFTTSGFSLFDLTGQIYGVGFISTDISARVDASERLNTSMQIFSEGSNGIVITDQHKKIQYVNPAFVEITGYTEHETLNKTLKLYESNLNDAQVYKNIWNKVNKHGKWEGEIWNKRKNGERYPQWLKVFRRPQQGPIVESYMVTFSDLTEHKKTQKNIEQLAYYDSLTGADNRNLLREKVELLIKQANRNNAYFSLFFLDLDHFKEINDLHGHDIGDIVLKEVTQRIRQLVREYDTVCRLGGDEFIILLPESNTGFILQKVKLLLQELEKPYLINNLKLRLSASIGIVTYPTDGTTYQTLVQHADTAMYKAKANGKNTYYFFEAALKQQLQQKVDINEAMHVAFENNEFTLHFQPKYNLKTGLVCGCEALLRWHSNTLGTMSPAYFIPIAEENGMILAIGNWVLHNACAALQQISTEVEQHFVVAINVSAAQFWQKNFVENVIQIIEHYEIKPNQIEFELTEHIAMQRPEQTAKVMHELKNFGISFALDDFGTGFSSLSYLKNLPIDALKLDGSFVKDIGKDKEDEVLCQAIINLARSLNIHTVAECVENEEQQTFLRDNFCDCAQGYLFCKPVSLSGLLSFIHKNDKPTV